MSVAPHGGEAVTRGLDESSWRPKGGVAQEYDRILPQRARLLTRIDAKGAFRCDGGSAGSLWTTEIGFVASTHAGGTDSRSDPCVTADSGQILGPAPLRASGPFYLPDT